MQMLDFALLAILIYCVIQIVRDLRRRNYGMAALGLACIAALSLAPIQTHAVKIDLPMAPAK